MILPTKKLSPENSILFIGGNILTLLDQPKTVSRIWQEMKDLNSRNTGKDNLNYSYDWFILAMDFLFITGAIELTQGTLNRRSR